MRTVYWYSGSNRIQYVTPKHSPQRITPFSVISIEILCANAVIDTFVTSKGFNFLFNHVTVWMAFSIESNNARPLPRARGWAATTCFHESGSNNFLTSHICSNAVRPSNRFASSLSGQKLPYFYLFWLFSIGVRNPCTQTTHTCTVALLHQVIYFSPQFLC